MKNDNFSPPLKALPEDFLKSECLKIPKSGIQVIYFLEEVNFIPSSETIGVWNEDGGILLFVDEQGDTYMTFATHPILNLLNSCGFIKDPSLRMPITLIKGGFPAQKHVRQLWDSVCRTALTRTS